MSVADVVTCALAREVRPDDVVGVGLGTPLALCAALVAQRTVAPGATLLVGGAPVRSPTLAQCLRHDLAGTTPGYVSHLDTMDMAERQVMTLQFFRPAQIGPDGAANTSRVRAGGRLVRFPGGLALADTPNLMPRVLYYHTAHEPRSFPATVDFRTHGGGGIERAGYTALGATKVVTDRCVIAFGPDGARLESVHPGESVEAVVGATGFTLRTEGSVETPAPSEVELAALAAVDPERLRERELKRLPTTTPERRASA